MIGSTTSHRVADFSWPDGKDFAFTVFDDTDLETLDNAPIVYSFLEDCGLRTTKSVWPIAPAQEYRGAPWWPSQTDEVIDGATCDDPAYRSWVQTLQSRGFEIALHNATYQTSPRAEIRRALNCFQNYFGRQPDTHANHVGCLDGMYWGDARLTSWRRLLYNALHGFRRRGQFQGHVTGSDLFWGDLCRDQIAYVRNFVFGEINTLKMCPMMPYYDPLKPYVKGWFASSEGPEVNSFVRMISESNQDRLEAEGGACIMYTHFGKGFVNDGGLDQRFHRLMKRLSEKNGWFVPVNTLLNYLKQVRGEHIITNRERARLEWGWLRHKFQVGGSS